MKFFFIFTLQKTKVAADKKSFIPIQTEFTTDSYVQKLWSNQSLLYVAVAALFRVVKKYLFISRESKTF